MDTSEIVPMVWLYLEGAGLSTSQICPFILLSTPKSEPEVKTKVWVVNWEGFQEASVREQGEWDREGGKTKVRRCYWSCCCEQRACFYQDLKRSSQKAFQNWLHGTMGGLSICQPSPVPYRLRLPPRSLTSRFFWTAFVCRENAYKKGIQMLKMLWGRKFSLSLCLRKDAGRTWRIYTSMNCPLGEGWNARWTERTWWTTEMSSWFGQEDPCPRHCALEGISLAFPWLCPFLPGACTLSSRPHTGHSGPCSNGSEMAWPLLWVQFQRAECTCSKGTQGAVVWSG